MGSTASACMNRLIKLNFVIRSDLFSQVSADSKNDNLKLQLNNQLGYGQWKWRHYFQDFSPQVCDLLDLCCGPPLLIFRMHAIFFCLVIKVSLDMFIMK